MANFLKKSLAFTLAETLIVMGVIGIVSALTLPNLNASTGEKEKVAKVKKLYQNINDAYERAVAVYGPFDEWFTNDSTTAAQTTRFAERLTEFMKVSKNCGIGNDGKCFTTTDKYFLNSTATTLSNYKSGYNVILADGTSVDFYLAHHRGTATDKEGQIYIDIDGYNKGNSAFGKDIFIFRILKNTGVHYLIGEDNNPCATDIECAGWIIQMDNMDYLKTTDGKTCSNGKVLSWDGNTSCK